MSDRASQTTARPDPPRRRDPGLQAGRGRRARPSSGSAASAPTWRGPRPWRWTRRRASAAGPIVRYDHFAHGQSSGDWRQATIGRWREDAIALIDSLDGPGHPGRLVDGRLGRPAGGAGAARADGGAGAGQSGPGLHRAADVAGPGRSRASGHPARRRDADRRGGAGRLRPDPRGCSRRRATGCCWTAPSRSPRPCTSCRAGPTTWCPGATPLALVERLTGGDVRLDLIEGGDHRLSSPADLARLVEAVERMRH